jgi:hypothetical protein
MAPTAPRTPAEHHYDVAESGLADLGRVGFDDAGPLWKCWSRSHTPRSLSPRDSPRTRMESALVFDT